MKFLTEIIGFTIVFGLISGRRILLSATDEDRERDTKLEHLVQLKNKASQLFNLYKLSTQVESHIDLTTSDCIFSHSACDPKQPDYHQILRFYYCSLKQSKNILALANLDTTITAIINQIEIKYSHPINASQLDCSTKCLDAHHNSDLEKQIYFWKVFQNYETCMHQAYQSLQG